MEWIDVKDRPDERVPLDVELEDHTIARAYYIKWSDTMYLNIIGKNLPRVIKWKYRFSEPPKQ